MPRVRNVKVNFDNKNYDTSSLFILNANAGVSTVTGVTYNQLTHNGSGYNFTIDDYTTKLSVTSSNGECIATAAENSFYSYPVPPISPIRIASSGSEFNQSGTSQVWAIAYEPVTDSIYAYNYFGIKKYDNISGLYAGDDGPFDNDPYSITSGDLFYDSDRKYFIYNTRNDPYFRILSSSGEMIYTSSNASNVTDSHYIIWQSEETLVSRRNRFTYDGSRYVYFGGRVFASGSNAFRGHYAKFDLDTLTFDWNYTTDKSWITMGSLDWFLPLTSSSDEAVIVCGYTSAANQDLKRIGSGSGNEKIIYAGGYINNAILADDGSVIIAGSFSSLQVSGSATVHTKYDIAKIDPDTLDPTPYTSSFNPYGSSLWRSFAASAGGTQNIAYTAQALKQDSNGNIFVGNCYFKFGSPGTYAWLALPNTYTSYTVLNSDGSFNSDWNFPVTASTNNNYSWAPNRIELQADDSYYILPVRSSLTDSFVVGGSLYDGITVGGDMFFSSSGILVDRIAP